MLACCGQLNEDADGIFTALCSGPVMALLTRMCSSMISLYARACERDAKPDEKDQILSALTAGDFKLRGQLLDLYKAALDGHTITEHRWRAAIKHRRLWCAAGKGELQPRALDKTNYSAAAKAATTGQQKCKGSAAGGEREAQARPARGDAQRRS